MISPILGLRGTGIVFALVVLFGLALIVLLSVIFLSTQPASA
jgi:hypothetical protein